MSVQFQRIAGLGVMLNCSDRTEMSRALVRALQSTGAVSAPGMRATCPRLDSRTPLADWMDSLFHRRLSFCGCCTAERRPSTVSERPVKVTPPAGRSAPPAVQVVTGCMSQDRSKTSAPRLPSAPPLRACQIWVRCLLICSAIWPLMQSRFATQRTSAVAMAREAASFPVFAGLNCSALMPTLPPATARRWPGSLRPGGTAARLAARSGAARWRTAAICSSGAVAG